ncbi:MAG TPA: ABC transporter substrate-binding protein [Methylomirabilota bacterium]|nr:ABC transporter substrate-binding protein [Methylomirabilota bacterium]
MRRPLGLLLALLLAGAAAAPAARAADAATITWGVHVSLAPTFFDPAEATGTALPLMVYYAMHDALVRPLPGQAMGAALATSWTVSRDGLVYEFVLRRGVVFHNGDPFTAEDVKFSFERYRGASATQLKAKVAAVEIVDPYRVRFRLKQPWPDFLTFYATPPPGRPGSCRRSTSRRWATRASRGRRWGRGPTSSSRSSPGSSW